MIVHEPTAIVHHKVSSERATLKYVFTYVFHEGTVRAMLEKALKRYTDEPLEGERRYLRSLITEAIPSRLKRIYRPRAAAQLMVILINTSLVGVGYLRGRVIYR
jgi:hypothetical protein